MPYVVRKLRNQNAYKVVNAITGRVSAKHTTLKKAKIQARILNDIDNIHKHIKHRH